MSKLLGKINIGKIVAEKAPVGVKRSAKKPTAVPKAVKLPVQDGPYLTKHFNEKALGFSKAELARARNFFNAADVRLEWSLYDYLKLPAEQEKHNYETLCKRKPEDELDPDSVEQHEIAIADAKRKYERAESNNVILPEVLLLGRCNVGKSSLLNVLLSDTKKPQSYARVRDYAGYTPCLNFYNVGNILRVVDSPGYGERGQKWQGELTLRYLERRKQMMKCYLLLDPLNGMNQYDQTFLEWMNSKGINYDIVFTKIDRLGKNRAVEQVQEFLDFEATRELLPIKPGFFFVNSDTSGSFKTCTGFDELRAGILRSTNLTGPLKPKRLRGAAEKDKEREKERAYLKLKEKKP